MASAIQSRVSAPRFNRAHHRFTLFLAGCALLLLVAGALVTSNDAGLSVPDWPTSFGSFRMPQMVGGIKWEHGHRMVAAFVGLLTIVLAVWTWRVDERRWMRLLGVGAAAGIVFQGVLGGLTVLNFLPPAISTAHAVVAQTMFCILAAMALFTSRGWRQEPLLLPPSVAARLKTLSSWLVASLYLQLILGAAFRHVWTKWGPHAANRMAAPQIVSLFLLPHIVNALIATALLVATTLVVFRRAGEHAQLRRPALLLHLLLLAQLLLGIAALFTRVVWSMDVPQPQLPLVLSTVAHLVVGAMLLAAAVVLAIQVRRASSPEPAEHRIPRAANQVATA